VRVVRRLLEASRYLVIFAVLGSLLVSAVTLIYGALAVVDLCLEAFVRNPIDESGAKRVTVSAIQIIDLFLVGTVLYIVALGLYQLFIDSELPMPSWLKVVSIDSLKEKLIGVVIVVLGVAFVGHVVEWKGDQNILYLGLAVGAVLAALGLIAGPGPYRVFGGKDKSAR
jgi:uncharacterized membrane protein YqhA